MRAHWLLAGICVLIAHSSARTVADPSTNGNEENPFKGRVFYANSNYGNKVKAAIEVLKGKNDTETASKASSLLNIGTFWWLDSRSSVNGLPGLLQEARIWEFLNEKDVTLQLVIYNLPDRDCSAKASDGELKIADGGIEKYREFIDAIARHISNYTDMRFAIVLEPDGLANVVTNTNPETGPKKCVGAVDAYKNSVAYAIAALQFPHVALYIDAGHCGWLGWKDNLKPAATVFTEVIAIANKIKKGSKVRGFATNVSNYNTYNASVIEPYFKNNPSYTENLFAHNISPYLKENGIDAHFLVDTGRNGQTGFRANESYWCNVKGTGFGERPTTLTNDSLIDALVWVKPGGESDGTTDTSSPRFDQTCVSPVALTPAPEAGSWFQAYFEMLIKNANPPLPIVKSTPPMT